MPRPRATMEESTGGTPTTPIAAGNEFTSDDGSRRSRDDDGGVDLEDSDDDWDPAATAVAGGGKKSKRKGPGLNVPLDVYIKHTPRSWVTNLPRVDNLVRRGSISKATHGLRCRGAVSARCMVMVYVTVHH